MSTTIKVSGRQAVAALEAEDRLVRLSVARQISGRSERSLWRDIAAGRLQAYRQGTGPTTPVYVRLSDVRKLARVV